MTLQPLISKALHNTYRWPQSTDIRVQWPIPLTKKPKTRRTLGLSSSLVLKVKLPALKGGASQEGISFYIVPLHPALKYRACGALAGQLAFTTFVA